MPVLDLNFKMSLDVDSVFMCYQEYNFKFYFKWVYLSIFPKYKTMFVSRQLFKKRFISALILEV